MTGPVFVDSNVLVYRRDSTERVKAPVAGRWLQALWRSRRGRLSIQVLSEFYTTVTRKLQPGLPCADARDEVREFLTWEPLALSAALVEGAFLIEERFALSYWDALIVAAARDCRCDYLLTEDLQDSQDFAGLVVVDPFRHEPAELGLSTD